MPVVPAPVRRVQTEPLGTPSPVRRDVSSGTEALARGVDQAADVATRAAQKARDEQRRARLQDAWTELGKVRIDIEDTARQQKGRSALESDLENQAGQGLETAAAKIEAELPDDLKGEFSAIKRQHELGLKEALTSHVGREAEAYRVQQYKGTLELAKGLGTAGAAAAGPGQVLATPEVLEARKSLLNAVTAQTKDAPPEAATAERIAQLTEFHAGVVESLAKVGRVADAAAYLNVAKGEMDAGRAAVLTKDLAGPAQVSAALGVVQEIEARIADPEKRTEAVLALEGPLAEKALQIHKEREAAREEVAKDLDRQRFGRVTEAIEKNVLSTRSQLEASIEFQRLSDEDRPRALKYLEDNHRQERSISAAERSAQAALDAAAVHEYEALAANDPKAAVDADVTNTYAGRVSKDGLDRIRIRQGQAKKSWDKDKGVSGDDFKSFVVSQVGQALKKKKDREAFVAAVDRDRQAWLEEHPGKEPPREEVRKWIASELTQGKAGDGWFRPTRKRYEVAPGEAFTPNEAGAAAAGTPAAGSPAQAPAAAAQKVPPPPTGTPDGWVPYRNARTGEVRYNAQGRAKGDWEQVP